MRTQPVARVDFVRATTFLALLSPHQEPSKNGTHRETRLRFAQRGWSLRHVPSHSSKHVRCAHRDPVLNSLQRPRHLHELPYGFDQGHLDWTKFPPSQRLTNIGVLFVTHEHDCTSADELDEVLSWIRGENGQFSRSRFADVDRALLTHRDYRGYSIVYSGRRSIQFHFVFSTEHLEYASYRAHAVERAAVQPTQVAAVMRGAHEVYWQQTAALVEQLGSIPLDGKMECPVQWRRAPFGTRVIDEHTPFLGLDAGMQVPQLVLHENIRQRVPKGASEFLVLPDFSVSIAATTGTSRQHLPAQFIAGQFTADHLTILQEICASEWGSEYPKPVNVEDKKGDALIQFKNHADDKNPSSIVLGDHRQLLLSGRHAPEGLFFLPDNMTANELIRHVTLFSEEVVAAPVSICNAAEVIPPELQPALPPARSFGEWKERRLATLDPVSEQIRRPLRGLIQVGDTQVERAGRFRAACPESVRMIRQFDMNYVLRAAEGFAKTSSHFDVIREEARTSSWDGRHGFTVVACRSRSQSAEKMAEYKARTGGSAVLIQSLRAIYEEVCEEQAASPLVEREFQSRSLSHFLGTVANRQPSIAKALEEHRLALWRDGASRFNQTKTILFTTHATVRLWEETHNTRIWHHPGFDLSMSDKRADELRADFRISRVVYDELEIDEFLTLMPENLHDCIARQQQKLPDWGKSYRDCWSHFISLVSDNAIPGKGMTFERFDSLMRLNLSALQPIRVDFGAIPFGYDNKQIGLYNGCDGNLIYVGAQSWMLNEKVAWGFLTTETLMEKVVSTVHAMAGRAALSLTVPNIPGIHPIKVPVVFDKRAAADRLGKPKVTALAKEIISANPNAFVIANGVHDDGERVLTFQSAKGYNGLEDRDVYIIVTNLAPDQYETLNVIGQFLDIPNVIDLHYRDQIAQAVGRNRGFRQSRMGATRTVIVTAKRLYDRLSQMHADDDARVRLVPTGSNQW